MFKNNFYMILEKGIAITDLLNSNIFRFEFDFDEWPSAHTNNEEFLRPYHGNILKLR
jgi:hypothetical protein